MAVSLPGLKETDQFSSRNWWRNVEYIDIEKKICEKRRKKERNLVEKNMHFTKSSKSKEMSGVTFI